MVFRRSCWPWPRTAVVFALPSRWSKRWGVADWIVGVGVVGATVDEASKSSLSALARPCSFRASSATLEGAVGDGRPGYGFGLYACSARPGLRLASEGMVEIPVEQRMSGQLSLLVSGMAAHCRNGRPDGAKAVASPISMRRLLKPG
jgi:hypothetical protein